MKVATSIYRAGLKSYETATSLLYSALRFRRRARMAFRMDDGTRADAVVVAMNGPTLAEDLGRIDANFPAETRIDYAVANHFADTKYFAMRRPTHYFFSDPYFWDDASDPVLIEKRIVTFDRIVKETRWPIRVYFPAHANPAKLVDHFSDNEMIELHPFNAASLPAEYSSLLGAVWKNDLCAPYGQNVLIHAIYGCIQLGYCQIGVAGAGFSFHKQIHVDQDDNTFMQHQRHVYGESTERAYVDQKQTKHATVSNEFKALYNAFRSLEAVSIYARLRGCEVVNYSNYSYLDMFDRPDGQGVSAGQR